MDPLALRASMRSLRVETMPTSDATLLPAIPEERGSDHSLDAVGPLVVLGAMVEQKKRASPSSPLRCAPPPSADGLAAADEIEPMPPLDDADDATPRRPPQRSDAFLKAR